MMNDSLHNVKADGNLLKSTGDESGYIVQKLITKIK